MCGYLCKCAYNAEIRSADALAGQHLRQLARSVLLYLVRLFLHDH
jgi:hypothetical protein